MYTVDNPEHLLHEPNSTNKTSYQTACPSWECLAEEAKVKAFWNQELQRVDRSELFQHEEEQKDWLKNEVFQSFVLRKEPSDGPIQNYIIHSEMGKLMEDNIKTTVEVDTRSAEMGIIIKRLRTYW